MAKEKTYPKIGTVMYVVPEHVSEKTDRHGAQVIVCRVKTYKNIKGAVKPVLSVVGDSKRQITGNHHVFDNLDKAINAISNVKLS